MTEQRLLSCKVPVTVVGCGSAGRRIVGNLLEEGLRASLLTLVDSAMVPSVLDVPVRHLDGRDSIGSPGGMVFVSVPMQSHASILERIRPDCTAVFLEKPSGPSEHSDRILKASVNWPVVVGYNWRFHPMATELVRALSTVDPAKVTLFASCHTDMGAWPGSSYGHPVYECSHEMDLAQWLLGRASVECVQVRGDMWRIVMCHSSGAMTVIEIRHRCSQYLRSVSLSSGFSWKTTSFSHAGNVPESIASKWAPSHMYRDCVASFAWFVASGRHPMGCPLPDAIAVADNCGRAIAMASESAR